MQAAFDPNMAGAVPFTLVIAPDGEVVYQESGAVATMALRRLLANLPDPKDYPGLQVYWSAK